MIKLSLRASSALLLKYICQNPVSGEDPAITLFKKKTFDKLPSFDKLNEMVNSEEKKEIEI